IAVVASALVGRSHSARSRFFFRTLPMVPGAIVTNVVRLLAFAVVAGALSLGLGSHVDACSCVQQTAAQQGARADVVFRGTVTVVEPPITGLVISSADRSASVSPSTRCT